MPFRSGGWGAYDSETLRMLQTAFELTQQALAEIGTSAFTAEQLAWMILKAYEQGIPQDSIKAHVLEQLKSN